MSGSIVERLRYFEDRQVPVGSGSGATVTERVYRNPDGPEAADTIEALVASLIELLAPLEAASAELARQGKFLDSIGEDAFDRARAALARVNGLAIQNREGGDA